MESGAYGFNLTPDFRASVVIGQSVEIVQIMFDAEKWSTSHGIGFDDSFVGSIQSCRLVLVRLLTLVATCFPDVSFQMSRCRLLLSDISFVVVELWLASIGGRFFSRLVGIGLSLSFRQTLHRERPNSNGTFNMAAMSLLLLLL